MVKKKSEVQMTIQRYADNPPATLPKTDHQRIKELKELMIRSVVRGSTANAIPTYQLDAVANLVHASDGDDHSPADFARDGGLVGSNDEHDADGAMLPAAIKLERVGDLQERDRPHAVHAVFDAEDHERCGDSCITVESEPIEGVNNIWDLDPVNIHRWWNRGIDVARTFGADYIAVLNDDVVLKNNPINKIAYGMNKLYNPELVCPLRFLFVTSEA